MQEQVQIRAIDLAWEWVKTYVISDLPQAPEPRIKELAKRFDQAYKAICETITQQ